jgi:hypothetical protein
MAQRKSEYARIEGDTYVTPKWVYDALYSVEPWTGRTAFDCAPVNRDGYDFLCDRSLVGCDVATNPPFNLADEFCRHALELCTRSAMLLPHAFDTAKGRIDLWGEPFKAKYTLTRRIRWENIEQKKNGPSNNHAWFVWDKTYSGKPFLGYLP